MLLTIPDVLTPAQLAEARQQLEVAHWQSGLLTAGQQARTVKNNEQLAIDDPAAQRIGHMIVTALRQHPMFFSAVLPKRFLTPRFNRYQGQTNAYGLHVDNAIRMIGPDQNLRTDVSCTVFLASPDSYDGGELSIRDTFGEHDIKLPAGHAVIYPGTSLHQVMPVTRGSRLACFMWIESLVRSDEQRRLLFDMDMALSTLRKQGESAATTQLTGTYHNLLRMWALT